MRCLALPLLVSLAACVTAADSTARPVAIGQSQRIGHVRITPLAIREDSRCPMNARCIWAGRVVVRTAIVDAGTRNERDLTLGEPTSVGRRTIVLDRVTPDREAEGEQRTPDYRFHYSVVS